MLYRFFFDSFQRFNKSYANVLNAYTPEGDEEREESGKENEDKEPAGEMGTFTAKWGWIYYLDIVATKVNDTWRNVQNMNVVEFLNIISYIRDKNTFEKEQMKKRIKRR